jgi:hypothetical protein
LIVAACRLLSAGNAVVTTWLNSFAQKTWHAQHQNKGLTQIFAAYLRCMGANASMSFASFLQKWGIKYLQVSQSSHACVHALQKEPKNGPTLVSTNANALMAANKKSDVRKYLSDSRTDPSDWKTGKSVEEIGKFVDLVQWLGHRSDPMGMADDGYVLEWLLFDRRGDARWEAALLHCYDLLSKTATFRVKLSERLL